MNRSANVEEARPRDPVDRRAAARRCPTGAFPRGSIRGGNTRRSVVPSTPRSTI